MKPKYLLALTLLVLLSLALPTGVSAENGAPIAENLNLQTYRGISVDGQLRATDPRNDTLTYQLTTPPLKGEVVVNEDGSFCYTPDPSRRGKDYFGYTATDSSGNTSQEATVIITLLKQKTAVTYADMTDSPLHYDAVRLAEQEIFVGAQINGDYVFSPDTMISRGEFMALCMSLSDLPILGPVTNTGCADDADIPPWQKPYIATAMMYRGAATVTVADSSAFQSTAPITCGEAAIMMDSIFNLSKVSAANLNTALPNNMAQAVANLTACRVLSANCDTAQYLNRGMTADMLSALMDVLEER